MEMDTFSKLNESIRLCELVLGIEGLNTPRLDWFRYERDTNILNEPIFPKDTIPFLSLK